MVKVLDFVDKMEYNITIIRIEAWMKTRYQITINWKGEVHKFYRHATSANQALRHSIRELARKVGYNTKYVRDYVMEDVNDRWKVEVK
jgi:hypothetical protein